MYRFVKYFAIALMSLLILVPAASAQRGRGFGGFRGYRGGWVGGYWGGGYYGPDWGWYAPYGYWGYPYGYGSYPYAYRETPSVGDVKIVGAPKDDSVYVDGGYAGTVGDLKKFKLRSGSHSIEVRDHEGRTLEKESVEVIPGKTLEIRATQGGR